MDDTDQDFRKSKLLEHIEKILSMEEQLKLVSATAFVALAEIECSSD